MMVANSFALWQKDAFFSAAEEVQDSADIMESVYRAWLRAKRDGLMSEDFDQLCQELQTALGTAKWQLEEFERAVRLSYGHCRDDNTITRHREFIASIENQISHVEVTLRQVLSEEGNQPLRWVTLEKGEQEDLAMFLAGTSQALHTAIGEGVFGPSLRSSVQENCKRKDMEVNSTGNFNRDSASEIRSLQNAGTDKDRNDDCVIEIETEEKHRPEDAVICQTDRTSTRRTCSTPNIGALKITVADEDEHESNFSCFESTPKEKGWKPVFSRQMCGEYSQVKGPRRLYNKVG